MSVERIAELEKELAVALQRVESLSEKVDLYEKTTVRHIDSKVKYFWGVITIAMIASFATFGTSIYDVKGYVDGVVKEKVNEHLNEIAPKEVRQDVAEAKLILENAEKEINFILELVHDKKTEITDTVESIQGFGNMLNEVALLKTRVDILDNKLSMDFNKFKNDFTKEKLDKRFVELVVKSLEMVQANFKYLKYDNEKLIEYYRELKHQKVVENLNKSTEQNESGNSRKAVLTVIDLNNNDWYRDVGLLLRKYKR